MASLDPYTGLPTNKAAPALTDPNNPNSTGSQYQPDLVSSRVNDIINGGGPIIAGARARADDASNSRGLLDSSMGVQAGEAAAFNAALPIATADSNATNTFGLQKLQGAQQENQAGVNAGYTGELTQQNADIQTGQLLPAQTAATKDVNQQNVDLQTNELIPAQTKASQDVATTNANLQAGTLIPAQTAATKQVAQTNADILTNQTLPAQTAAAAQLQEQKGQQATALQTLQGNQAQQVADIEGQYKNLLQTNASAASEFNNFANAINAINADQTTSSEVKQNAINMQIQMLKSALTIAGGISNLDLQSMLDFTA